MVNGVEGGRYMAIYGVDTQIGITLSVQQCLGPMGVSTWSRNKGFVPHSVQISKLIFLIIPHF